MMRVNILSISIVAALFFSCSKGSNKPQQSQGATITINGTAYPTVVIGTQTWTSLNYNGPGGVNYDNGANNPAYGKLYTWTEAQAISLPTGWRLPTESDFNNLMIAIGAQNLGNGSYLSSGTEPLQLMSKTGWSTTNGTNTLGFNAEPAGYYNQVTSGNQQFSNEGSAALFLSATPLMPHTLAPFSFIIGSGNAQLTDLVILSTDAASVRFVKDN